MAAPAGALVGIYYDGWETVEPGDYLRTPTGRTYLIESNRIQQRGKHAGRQHLKGTVMEPEHQPEPDAKIHLIFWYKR